MGPRSTQPEVDGPSGDAQVSRVALSDEVVIAGGGPVGLLLATVLAYYGVRWPKMDLTNANSMELFRKLGLAQGLRERGVPQHIPQPVLMSTGLGATEALTSWYHPSPDEVRARIKQHNDGTQPLEPYQRISQAIFERYLKELADKNPLIDLRYGWKVNSVSEFAGRVETSVTEQASGRSHIFTSAYVGGCDGGSSKVRQSLELPLDGGPVPSYVLLVHFKSKDLTRLHKQGQFWHIFFFTEGGQLSSAIIAQDEVDTWTTHLFLPLDMDESSVDSHEAVYKALGGLHGPYHIEIDEILVRSTYRPNIAMARRWISDHGRVFLAGDAAHQNIPTGGYGMNTGIADAFDLGWKLAAVVNGYGGPALLESYEKDRLPVATQAVERSGVHMAAHLGVAEIVGAKTDLLTADSEDGRQLRQQITDHFRQHDGENKDLGVEMGYRYTSSTCIPDNTSTAPIWEPRRYIPSTYPGIRVPHVFLRDGTPIFDRFGKVFTLVEFADDTEQDCGADLLLDVANAKQVPLKYVQLIGEQHAHQIWGSRLALVRPDFHSAWRGAKIPDGAAAESIITGVVGAGSFSEDALSGTRLEAESAVKPGAFTSTIGMTTQTDTFELEKMGEFQR